MDTIPHLLHQTVADMASVPDKVARELSIYAPDFQRTVYDNAQCEAFLKTHFPQYVATFLALRGAHKADLFRYAILYVRGGVYMDIKTPLVQPLSRIIDTTRHAIYTSLSGNPAPGLYPRACFQSMIASPPRQAIFLRLLEFMAHNVSKARDPLHYLMFTADMYEKILDDTKASELSHGEYASVRDPSLTYVLLREVCRNPTVCPHALDRYGLCCHVLDAEGNVQYLSRYHDYPW